MRCPDLTIIQVSARCKVGVPVKMPLTHIKALPVFATTVRLVRVRQLRSLDEHRPRYF
jgi:hypothetical protein